MLVALSVFLILIGFGLNRMSNRYYRRYAEQFADEPGKRMLRDMIWFRLIRWPPILLALFGYFFGLFLVGYGLLILIG